MSTQVTTEAAVVATCGRCGERSKPMSQEGVEGWARIHEKRHAKGDRRTHMADHGHTTDGHVDWFDNDDSSGYGHCSCGWKSRNVKTCNIDDMIDEHLREVEAAMAAE